MTESARQVIGAGEGLIERERAAGEGGLVVREVHQPEVESGLDIVPPANQRKRRQRDSSSCWAHTRCCSRILPDIDSWTP